MPANTNTNIMVMEILKMFFVATLLIYYMNFNLVYFFYKQV
jgi:hypothetical protein